MEIKNKISNSKGQVAIFIIIAIALVIAIVVIFMFWRGAEDKKEISEPDLYITECIKDKANEAIPLLLRQGGFINPELTIMNNGENITYLCYNQGYYKPCINQKPLLIEHEEKEITDYIKEEIDDCFLSIKEVLEDKGTKVFLGSMKITTELETTRAVIKVERKLDISNKGAARSYSVFETKVTTSLYELSEIAMEIVNQEAQYCNFENLGFMIIYPNYDIRKENVDGSLIYSVKKIDTGETFKFAVRGCVMPAGL